MKEKLRAWLEAQCYEDIAEFAAGKKRALGTLVSLTYDADPLIAWRAVEAMGIAASRVAETSTKFVRNQLRRLHWLISEESGGICWYAPQAMAEIIRHQPKKFESYASIVVTLLTEMAEEDLDHFRPGVLWAIGRLGSLAESHLKDVLPAIVAALEKPDPQARGMAVWCLQQLGRDSEVTSRETLLGDEGQVNLYEGGQLGKTTVAELAQRSIG